MSAKSHTAPKGFTIIEVLIVLAVAGLIMMMIFAVIPTLQRNSRNNQRKQEVSNILQAVSHYELNNSGTFPGPCGDGNGHPVCNADSTQPLFYTKLSFYDYGNVAMVLETSGQSVSNPNDSDKVAVYNYQKCSSTSTGAATSAGAGYNDVVALYALETADSATPTQQCTEL